MTKNKQSKSLRDLATAPFSAFRRKTVIVPEWEGVSIQIREPSAGAWLDWQEIIQPENEAEDVSISLPRTEKVRRNLRADIVLFVDVLLDEGGEHVFTSNDTEMLVGIYGPVHARLLRQAMDLSSATAENVEAK